MRLRAGASLFLIAICLGVGCRKVITPDIDRNSPPETWITAAPLDTVGGRGIPAPLGTIPYRFHLYWAGSDPDGEVVGFFFAVTETTAIPSPGEPIPPLPGPKPQDYQFTTKTDSIFIFNVVEGKPDRQHGFFIYAVDNEGKPDAAPARFVFNALDKSPPIPIITKAEARGTIYTIGSGGVVQPLPYVKQITDVYDTRTLPRDTVASQTTFTFEWTAQIKSFGGTIQGYKYRFVETEFCPTQETSKFYPVGRFADCRGETTSVRPALQIFTLRALDEAGGSVDSTRRVVVNLAPDTWLSGPNLDCVRSNPSFRFADLSGYRPYYYFLLTGPDRFPKSDPLNLPPVDVPCSYFGPALPTDPTNPENWVNKLYADRPEHRTFFEWWEDTLFVRSEGDTVHKNSYCFFINGGLDFDSPHTVLVPDAPPPGIVPDGPNTRQGPPNGSPQGFSGRVIVGLDPNRKSYARPTESLTYPDFRYGTSLYRPVPALRDLALRSGEAFARVRSVDGDGLKDTRIGDAVALANRAGECNPSGTYDQLLRCKVITYFINKAPVFTNDPLKYPNFVPQPNQVFTSNPLELNLLTWDADPANIGETTDPGRKGNRQVSRLWVRLRGDSAGAPKVFEDLNPDGTPHYYLNNPRVNINVPSNFSPGTVLIDVELCDCQNCEANLGEGRCHTVTFPIQWQPTSASGPGSAVRSGS